MIQISGQQRRQAFSVLLRTGRLPSARAADGIELKFNPWHDPNDGRFTFAGSGRSFGRGETKPSGSMGRRSPISTRSTAVQRPGVQAARHDKGPILQSTVEARAKRPSTAPAVPRPSTNAVAEFAGGVGQGVYDVAADTARAAYRAVTTNPITTVGDIERGVAGMIDTAIAAEDTPARVQLSRAANAVANASPREVDHAVGSVAGNVALAVAPGATLARISAVRRLRMARPSPGPFPPARVGWVKENLGPDSAAKRYNDAATGARPGQAPTLQRTLPDGSMRPVKFDGVDGDTLIDRKWGIRNMARARAQALRQSQALTQNRLVGLWEVPSDPTKRAALKMLRELHITNIKVRVVKP